MHFKAAFTSARSVSPERKTQSMGLMQPLYPYLPGFFAASISCLLLLLLETQIARVAKEQGHYRVWPGVAGFLILPLYFISHMTDTAHQAQMTRGWLVTIVVMGGVWLVSKLRKSEFTLR